MTAYICGVAIKPLADKWPSVYPRLPIGAVVYLKSGSPLMVIVDYETALGGYVCAWNAPWAMMQAREELFSANVLIVVKMGKRG